MGNLGKRERAKAKARKQLVNVNLASPKPVAPGRVGADSVARLQARNAYARGPGFNPDTTGQKTGKRGLDRWSEPRKTEDLIRGKPMT